MINVTNKQLDNMKKTVKIVIAGLMVFCGTVCIAQDKTVCTSTSYTVPSAVGVTGATYQWLENGAVVSGATGESYTNTVGQASAGTYVYVRRAHTEACGWQSSNAFIVSVTGSMAAPVITAPANGCNAINYVFTVPLVDGVTYEWTGGGTQNSNSYTYSNASPGAMTVTVRAVKEDCASAFSGATATAYVQPVINTPTAEPAAVCWGGTSTLSVTASGSDLTYQWLKGGDATTEGSNYTSANYTTGPVTATANYSVVVGNTCSTITSSVVVVTKDDCPTEPGATVPFSEFNPDPNADTGTVWYLTDEREADNTQTYAVKKMADDRIWMVQDLKFGDKCKNNSFSSAESNTTNAVSSSSTTYYGSCTDSRSETDTETPTPAERGYLYNWAAAVNKEGAYYNTETYKGCTGTTSGYSQTHPCQGICPDGWHLPTSAEYNDATTKFQYAYGCKAQGCWDAASAWVGVLGGIFDPYDMLLWYQGTIGYYWSSTYVNEKEADGLGFNYEWLSTTARGYKDVGRSVRCVRN
jgi:uncharacterized protein (TIGR02145 family)